MNNKFAEALFWALLILSTVLFLWRLFGNSPTGDAIVYPLVIAILVKVWKNGEATAVLKTKVKNLEKQFEKIESQLVLLVKEVSSLSQKVEFLSKYIIMLSKASKRPIKH